MRKTLKNITAATLITASVAAAPAVFAATSNDNAQAKGQMMQGHDQMGGDMGMKQDSQMPMMKMMSQMNEMMATCNQMMQTQMKKSANPKGSADKG